MIDPQVLENLKFAWAVLVTVCSLLTAVVVMWSTKNFITRKEHEVFSQAIEETLQEHANRLTAIETEMRSAPKHADLVALSAQLSNLRSQISELKGQSTQTNHLLSAIHEHLLNAD